MKRASFFRSLSTLLLFLSPLPVYGYIVIYVFTQALQQLQLVTIQRVHVVVNSFVMQASSFRNYDCAIYY